MYAIMQKGQGGFTLLELMLALAVFGFLLAVGVPQMTMWSLSNKAAGAAELYTEGFKLARQQALSHNGASRIVFSPNVANGQMDWQVDICFPTPAVPCSNTSGVWSTTDAAATGDPQGTDGYKSVFRSAAALPQTEVLRPTLLPEDSTAVYFSSNGWVAGSVPGNLSQIRLDPTSAYAAVLRSTALVVNLAGTVTKCDPTVGAGDSRGCPP